MAIESYTVQLERVQGAIAAIESGAQTYTLDGVTYTRGDLGTLYKREERLRPLAEREGRAGARVRYGVPLC